MTKTTKYTEEEKSIIFAAYKENIGNKSSWLEDLSILLGRPKPNISRFARMHGLTSRHRNLSKGRIVIDCGICDKPTTNYKYCSRDCSRTGTALARKGSKLWANRPHPRGMLGKTHTPEYRKQLSIQAKARWSDKDSVFNSKAFKENRSIASSRIMNDRIKNNPSSIYSRTQKGWAEFPNGKRCFFRSGWELRYANHLEMIKSKGGIKDWEYEADTFWFEKIRRGVRSYTPDFKIFFNDGTIEYHEVKGWMDSKSATKLKRMRIYHPNIKLTVIGQQEMKGI